MTAITSLSATTLATEIRTGKLSAAEVTEAHIQRIEAVNPQLNAVVFPLFEDARAGAKRADQQLITGKPVGPLHGVPITIKDQFHIKGLPTTFGVARLENNIAAEDGIMVRALRGAGAIILGKTNVSQTLAVVETDNAIWGRTSNPWDLNRSSGGSSGGEAAIISAGGSPLGLGGDIGGSIRIPAAYCGIYGLKPTSRRLPVDPGPIRTASGAEGIINQPGPLARTAADLSLAFKVMVDYILAHPTLGIPPVPYQNPQTVNLEDIRVALLPQIGDWSPAPAIRRALQEASDALQDAGVTVEEWTSAPDTEEGINLFFKIMIAEGFSWARQLLGNEKPVPIMKPTMQIISIPNALIPLLAAQFKARGQHRVTEMLRGARRLPAAGLMNLLGDRFAYEHNFLAAMDAGNYDAILCPVVPLPAVRHGDTPELADFFGSCALFNALGFPAGVAPITRVRPGEESDRPESKDKAYQTARESEQGTAKLPVGVQIAARPWREDIILALLAAMQDRIPPLPYPFQSLPPS